MFSVILPSKDTLLLHFSVEIMGSVTVRRVDGIWPPLGLVYPQPDTRQILPSAMEAPCRGSRAMEMQLFRQTGAFSCRDGWMDSMISKLTEINLVMDGVIPFKKDQQFTYLYKHNVVVVCGSVVLRVGNQKLRQDFLFCALIDGQRVVPSHYHHFVYPKIKTNQGHVVQVQQVCF